MTDTTSHAETLARLYAGYLFDVVVVYADEPGVCFRDVVDFDTLIRGYSWLIHILPHYRLDHFNLSMTANLVQTTIRLAVQP
jgi:hypothetical protein